MESFSSFNIPTHVYITEFSHLLRERLAKYPDLKLDPVVGSEIRDSQIGNIEKKVNKLNVSRKKAKLRDG